MRWGVTPIPFVMALVGSLSGLVQATLARSETAATAPANLCSGVKPSKSPGFSKSQSHLAQAMAKFANDPQVAGQADAVLSKLIAAKSPVATEWISKRATPGKSEDDLVREWREYYAQLFVLSKYPHSDAPLNSKIEKLMDEVYGASFPSGERKGFEKAFRQAQAASLNRLAQMKLPVDAAKKASERIQAIRLYWMPAFKDSKFKTMPLEALSWGVAYDPAPNEINVGIEALKYSDEPTRFAVFAHEIGHAVDPCRWGVFLGGENPFKEVIACLRDSKSVGAKIRDDSRLDAFVKAGGMSAEQAAVIRANATCNRSNYPPSGLQADQSPEAFADWFSAEVLSAVEESKKPVRRDLCEAHELSNGSSYPSNEARLSRIYFAHPGILKAQGLKLQTDVKYCPAP